MYRASPEELLSDHLAAKAWQEERK